MYTVNILSGRGHIEFVCDTYSFQVALSTANSCKTLGDVEVVLGKEIVVAFSDGQRLF